ncbi:MAG: hypothetical protein IT365_17530 [Candidatus Hydrogenedentes bacterium]|nr:hypothetical protein [Candidatus Hydrogenedentota bacterium]
MTNIANAWDRSRFFAAVTTFALLLLFASVVGAATVQLTSNGAILVYDDAFTSDVTLSRTNDTVEFALSTSVNPDAVPDDIIGLQILNVAGSSITLAETITNSGAFPWHEWVEEPFNVVNPLNPPTTLAPSWASYASVAFGSSSAVAGTFEEVLLLGVIPGLVFRFDTPLLPGESFRLQKTLTYGGPFNDDEAGVQVLSFGAALPLPSAVWLLGSAFVGLFVLMRRKPPGA